MPTNFYMFFIAGLIPMIIGSIYYHPSVFGNAWMKTNKFTAASLEGGNMFKIFGFAYLFSVIFAFALSNLVIHQGGTFGMMYPEVLESGSATQQHFNELMVQYGDKSRSFRHGAIHGLIYAVILIWPVIGTISLFERRGWKYTLIHFGYWAIVLILMGGLICATLKYAPLS